MDSSQFAPVTLTPAGSLAIPYRGFTVELVVAQQPIALRVLDPSGVDVTAALLPETLTSSGAASVCQASAVALRSAFLNIDCELLTVQALSATPKPTPAG